MLKLRTLSLLLVGLWLAACSADEDFLEAYRQDFGLLQTDAYGAPTTFRRDDGATFSVAAGARKAEADTLLRVRALYVAQDSHTISLRDYGPVLTVRPRTFAEGQFRADPLRLIALWKGGGFLNFSLSLPTANNTATHYLAVADHGTTTRPDGTQIRHLSLYHDANGDGASWHRDAYLCCDLAPLAATLTAGRDSLEVAVSTETGQSLTRIAL